MQGDGNIRYFELVDEEPYVYFLTEHRTNVSTKVSSTGRLCAAGGVAFVMF